MKARTFFNFGYNNHLGCVGVVSDYDYGRIEGVWLSGRILGKYISLRIPIRRKLRG